jgi:teichuronic acid biosynthesis glycosyltransferase TuaG
MEKVSVVMAAYNASNFIRRAIQSVLDQTYSNLELIVINDGSDDNTDEILREFTDARVKYLSQNNRGVSGARNRGLGIMSGDFFCFLDADDILPLDSIERRMDIMLADSNVTFVDGEIDVYNVKKGQYVRRFRPTFRGRPREELLKLRPSCFFGLTWLIRRNKNEDYAFDESLKHGEDLDFLISISEKGLYDYTTSKTLIYQTGYSSAMSNLEGLEIGYVDLVKKWKLKNYLSYAGYWYLKIKMMKIMLLSYLAVGEIRKAVRTMWTFATL